MLAWNNSALFFGIALGSLIGGKAVAIGGFDAALVISAAIAMVGCVINVIVVPVGSEPKISDRCPCSSGARQPWTRPVPDEFWTRF